MCYASVFGFILDSVCFLVSLPQIKSRQFDVTLHFNRRTPANDYLGEAYKKVLEEVSTHSESMSKTLFSASFIKKLLISFFN